jgi:hypothetical protein
MNTHLSRVMRRIVAAVVTSLAVLALGLGVAAPATHAEDDQPGGPGPRACRWGQEWFNPGTQITVVINGKPTTLECQKDGQWKVLSLVRPTDPRPPSVTPSPPLPR